MKINQRRHNSLLVFNHHTVWTALQTSSTLEGKTSSGLASVRFPSGGKLDRRRGGGGGGGKSAKFVELKVCESKLKGSHTLLETLFPFFFPSSFSFFFTGFFLCADDSAAAVARNSGILGRMVSVETAAPGVLI